MYCDRGTRGLPPPPVASLSWYNLNDGPSFGPTLIKKVMEGLLLQYSSLVHADWPGYIRLSSGRMKPQVEGFVAFRYMPRALLKARMVVRRMQNPVPFGGWTS